MAGSMLSLQLLAALAAAAGQALGTASVEDWATPRQLTSAGMKAVILDIGNDGSAYFDSNGTAAAYIGQPVAAQQWRLLTQIWTGNVIVSRSGSRDKAIASPAVPGQWKLGDIIVVPGSTTASSTPISEADDKRRKARAMFIFMIVLMHLVAIGCVIGVMYSIKDTKRDAREGLGSAAAGVPPAQEAEESPAGQDEQARPTDQPAASSTQDAAPADPERYSL